MTAANKTRTPIKARAGGRTPCPVCGAPSKGCSVTADDMHLCRGAPGPGWHRLTEHPDAAGFHHYRAGDAAPRDGWGDRAAGYAAALTDAGRRKLARALGLPADALAALPLLGCHRDAGGDHWTFPEVDAGGTVTGITRRYADGTKKAMAGSTRGLTVPAGWATSTGPVLLVEGASDVLALSRCGLAAVGRPSNTGGVEQLVKLLDWADADRTVYLLGENDRKPDGSWPGRDGAERSARRLAEGLGLTVRTAYPPDDHKDCRAWVLDLLAGQGEAEDWELIGREVLAHLEAAACPVCPAPSLTAEPRPADADLNVSATPWPDPLGADALHGLAGDVVRAIDPHTEADPAAILFQFLVGFGNMVGRKAYYRVESSKHYANLFAVMVGQSSRARKGTSWQRAFDLLRRGGDEGWARTRVVSGLSSGEGLIWEVRDPVTRRQPVREAGKVTGHETVEVDGGVEDKRALVIEEEFASVLQVGKREGSILGSVLRSAWDTGRLGSLVKSSPARSTGAHISIISHITRTELLDTIHMTQAHNGFLNRFLWAAVRRSKLLPDGGREADTSHLATRLEAAWRFGAAGEREVGMTDEARRIWRAEYPRLTADRPGLFGAVTSRSEAQTLRLALVYALLDSAELIGVPHLRAALAVERYVEQSARNIFGDATGDTLADEIRAVLRAAPEGVSQLDIINHFGRHKPKVELERALGQLVAAGMATCAKVGTGGRPRVMWRASKPCEESEVSAESPPGGGLSSLTSLSSQLSG